MMTDYKMLHNSCYTVYATQFMLHSWLANAFSHELPGKQNMHTTWAPVTWEGAQFKNTTSSQ